VKANVTNDIAVASALHRDMIIFGITVLLI